MRGNWDISYTTPTLSIHRTPTPKLFDFLQLFGKPCKITLDVAGFGDIGDSMTQNFFEGIFVNTGFFGKSGEVDTAVMGTVIGVETEFIPGFDKQAVVLMITIMRIVIAFCWNFCKQIFILGFLSTKIIALDVGEDLRMDRHDTVFTGFRFGAAFEPVLLKIDIFDSHIQQFIRTPTGIKLDVQDFHSRVCINDILDGSDFSIGKIDVLFFRGQGFGNLFLWQSERASIILCDEVIGQGVVVHEIQDIFDPDLDRPRERNRIAGFIELGKVVESEFQFWCANLTKGEMVNTGNVIPFAPVFLDRFGLNFLGVLRYPLFKQLLHCYIGLETIWILVVFHKCGISIIIRFKIGDGLQGFCNGAAFRCLANGYQSTIGAAKVPIFDFGYLTKAVWQTPMPVCFSIFGIRRFLEWEPTVRAGEGFIADLEFAFGAGDEHKINFLSRDILTDDRYDISDKQTKLTGKSAGNRAFLRLKSNLG